MSANESAIVSISSKTPISEIKDSLSNSKGVASATIKLSGDVSNIASAITRLGDLVASAAISLKGDTPSGK